MKKNETLLSIAYFTFLLLTVVSGSLDGIMSDLAYYFSFIFPLFAVILFTDRALPRTGDFSLSGESRALLLPAVFPTVLAIALISLATSAVISLFGGAPPQTEVGDDIISALFVFAFLPSVFEELLFRYLPMRYIAPYSKRSAVIFSAIFFALAHHSFFSIPYALFAGAVFMTMDLLCGSTLPSMILHFVNNAVSIVWSVYFEGVSPLILLILLTVLAALSLIGVFKLRRRYISGIREIFSDKGENFSVLPMILAAVISVLAATIELVT